MQARPIEKIEIDIEFDRLIRASSQTQMQMQIALQSNRKDFSRGVENSVSFFFAFLFPSHYYHYYHYYHYHYHYHILLHPLD